MQNKNKIYNTVKEGGIKKRKNESTEIILDKKRSANALLKKKYITGSYPDLFEEWQHQELRLPEQQAYRRLR